MNVQPLHDWILVKLDPLPEEQKVGSIFVPDSAAERVRTALVVRIGPGRKNARGERIPLDVRPYTKVAFFREHLEHQQGKQILQRLEDGYALIRAMDLLGEVADEADDTLRSAFGYDGHHAALSVSTETPSAEDQTAYFADPNHQLIPGGGLPDEMPLPPRPASGKEVR